ncbi:hypothetical protein KL932_004665 [Ogataea haglerorum]|nr:hypothetical protein KL932_004665 [Ogataea haglerorum]KAG7756876.1 hypothetical protein KL947_003596 [Ogataea haglerorum]KAG7805464.1 hypothetical protein KL924_004881 [Ogataea haglerorum]
MNAVDMQGWPRPPIKVIPANVVHTIAVNINNFRDLLNFSLVNKSCYNEIINDSKLWIGYLKTIHCWKRPNSKENMNGKTPILTTSGDTSLLIDEELTPINCVSKSVSDPNLARLEFIKIYEIMAPISNDLLVKNYSNFQSLAVFKEFNDPFDQSMLFAGVSKFIQIYKHEDRYRNMVIRLNTILDLFVTSVIREIEIRLRQEDFTEARKLISALDNLNLDIGDIEVDSLEALLEFFLDRYVDAYSFLSSKDTVDRVLKKTTYKARGVVKGYYLDFVEVDNIFDQVASSLNKQLSEIDKIFDTNADEVPIVLKLMETFLGNYFIGGLVEKLINRAKHIDGLDEPVDLEEEQEDEKVEPPHVNIMNENSLYFQCVPFLYHKLLSTFEHLNYPQSSMQSIKQATKMDYSPVITGFINFYYEPHLVEFSDQLPKQCHQSLVHLIDTWELNKAENEKMLEQEILKFVDDSSEAQTNHSFDIFSSFSNIFRLKGAKKTEKEEIENEKRLTKFAAKLQILTTNVQNIKSLVSMDLTVLILQHVKNSYDLLLGLTKNSSSSEIKANIYKVCQDIFIDMLSTLIDRHIKSGFQEALTRLKEYNPAELEVSVDFKVEPLTNFIELVNVGDLILQMINIFYNEELVKNEIVKTKPQKNRDFLSSNQCEKTISKLELMLDTYVADGLDISIGVIMNEVNLCILRSQVNEGTYNLVNMEQMGIKNGQPSVYIKQTVTILESHFKMLSESIDKSILDIFKEEIGERFIATFIKLLTKKLNISTIGAIQFITDINYLYDFFVKYKIKQTVQYLVAFKEISQLFLIECDDKKKCKDLGKLVIDLGRDNGIFSPEEVYSFVSRRSDWVSIKRSVDKIMYGFGPDDCTIV